MMTTDELIAKVHELLEPLMDDTDIFVTGIHIKPTANIKVYLDADSGLTVEKSMKINRGLRAAIDAEAIFPEGDYSLEVSSPGIGEPITSQRQYKKNIGRLLEVEKTDGTTVTGFLREMTETELILEIKIPKKKETRTETVALSDVKSATVQVVF